MSLAMNDPKELRNLAPKKRGEVNMDELPAMLRIPKKKKKELSQKT